MRRSLALWAKRTSWQLILAILAFIQVAGTYNTWTERLYLGKWLAGLAIALSYFMLGRCRISRELTTEFAMLVAVLAIGLLAQLSDTIDGRALALVTSYTMTGTTAFLVAPAALRRRSVQRIIWPALLLGVTVATVLGIYLGFQDIFNALTVTTDRVRFGGAFYSANAAGVAGLIGVILAVAAFETKHRWRYLDLATIPFFMVVLFLSGSRGSVVAAIAYLAVIPILRIARWPPQRAGIALSLGAMGLIVLGILMAGMIDWPAPGQWQPVLNRFSSGRWTNWKDALSYLDGPLRWMFGLGMSRNFSFAFQETNFPVPVRGSNADNFFIDILGRTGIVGLLLILGIIGSLALRMWRGVRGGSPGNASQCILGLAALTSTLVLGQTNSVIFTWAWLQAMVAWPLIGAAATRPIDSPARTPPA